MWKKKINDSSHMKIELFILIFLFSISLLIISNIYNLFNIFLQSLSFKITVGNGEDFYPFFELASSLSGTSEHRKTTSNQAFPYLS